MLEIKIFKDFLNVDYFLKKYMGQSQIIDRLNNIHKSVPPDFYDQGIKNNLFQAYWHKKRFKLLKELTKNIKGNILDLGCHGGALTGVISESAKNSKIYGLDISENAIRYAQKQHPNINFQVCDLDKGIPYENEMFDAITCFDVLEHMANPSKIIDEIKRVLKKNGLFIIEIPNETMLFKLIWIIWTNWTGKVWKNAHVHSFKPKDLKKLLENKGFVKTNEKKIHLQMLWVIEYKLKQ